jgi:hypothetical protein
MTAPHPSAPHGNLVAYQIVILPGIVHVDGTDSPSLEYIRIHALHAGEPLKMFYENDGLWHSRLAAVFGEAEATAVMTQIELGDTATLPGAYTRETLAQLRFHPDILKIA